MTAIGSDLEPGRGRSRSDLYARRPVPVLAGRLGDEPHPAWLEGLIHVGRLWVDRRGWHAGSGEGRVDLDPEDYVIFDESGELRTCHPLMFRTLFEPFAPPRQDGGAEDASDAPGDGEWAEHRLRWLEATLPDGVELDGRGLHALRPIPVLAARLSEETHPDWLERLREVGKVLMGRQSCSAYIDGGRTEMSVDDYLVIDAAGRIEGHDPSAFAELFAPYEPSTQAVARDDVFLNVAYHAGEVRFVTGYVGGWGGLRWRLSADGAGEGTLTVLGRDVDEDDGPRDAWTLETSIDAGLAERALGTDGPCVRTASQRELAGIVAEALSRMDASFVRRSLLDELRATAPLPMGRRV